MSFPECLVSVVVPVLNEAACLPRLVQELRAACDGLPYAFEFLFVDDGSTDETVAVLAELHHEDERICYLALARNFGHQAALSAGLEHATGDVVITMDGDLQHPPRLIPQLLEQWQAGFDVVNTLRCTTADSGPLKQLCSRAFYRVFNGLANLHIEPGSADFRLLARPVVDALNRTAERHRFYRGLVPWVGFRQTCVAFHAPPRWAGRAKFTFLRSLRFALDGITSFSYYPLRLMTLFGLLVVCLTFLYGAWSLAAHLLGGYTVPGWTSLQLSMLFLGGCQILGIGLLGEYVGRIFEQVKGRPLYVVRAGEGLPDVPGPRRPARARLVAVAPDADE